MAPVCTVRWFVASGATSGRFGNERPVERSLALRLDVLCCSLLVVEFVISYHSVSLSLIPFGFKPPVNLLLFAKDYGSKS